MAFKTKQQHAADDRRRVELWQTVLGNREARSIDYPTMDRFARDRRAGRITIPGRKLSEAPGPTTIGADIVFLQSVFNWSLTVKLSDGSRLLTENPIRGYERPKNRNPKQPLATYDRFLKVRAVADEADPQGLFGSFMDLIEGLRWRVSAICKLQRDDIDRKRTADAPSGQIRKSAANDKENVEAWIPLSDSTRAAIDRILERNPVLGDLYLFPAVRNRETTGPHHGAASMPGIFCTAPRS